MPRKRKRSRSRLTIKTNDSKGVVDLLEVTYPQGKRTVRKFRRTPTAIWVERIKLESQDTRQVKKVIASHARHLEHLYYRQLEKNKRDNREKIAAGQKKAINKLKSNVNFSNSKENTTLGLLSMFTAVKKQLT